MGQCFSSIRDVADGSSPPPQTSHTAIGGGDLSPIYSSLPSGAIKVKVRNVYDGDTLTLVDERRIRFLGMDTPELKPKEQPFAQEAKAYTKNLCQQQQHDVWISHEPDGYDQQDHYGRLLCFVWVRQPGGGYLCVNEDLVQQGLANAYSPGGKKKLHNWKKLLALQNQARLAKRGLWGTFNGNLVVYRTANGSAYHKKSCSHLKRSNNLVQIKASQASAEGLHPCRTCLGG